MNNNVGVVNTLVAGNAFPSALNMFNLRKNISKLMMSTSFINIVAWLTRRPDFSRLYRWLCSKVPGNKMFTRKEIAKVAPVVFSLLFAAASMRVPEPGKEPSVQKVRGAILGSLTVFNGFAYNVNLCMDYEDDGAQFWHYIAVTPSGERVFYYKVFQHYMGLVVLLTSFMTSFYNFVYKDPWIIYYMSMASWSFSMVYALLQVYKTDKKRVIVEESETGINGVLIHMWSGRPPCDRFDWHVRVPEGHIALDIGK